MRTTPIALMAFFLCIGCSKDFVQPSNTSPKSLNYVNYNGKVALVLGNIRGMQLLLEDGTVVTPVLNSSPGYLHDSAFYKLSPGTVVSLSFDVYPCNGCFPRDFFPERPVILRGFDVVDHSTFIPKKDTINPTNLKTILSRNSYFATLAISSRDSIDFPIKSTFSDSGYSIGLNPPINKTVASGNLDVTESGTVRFTQMNLNPTLPTIAPDHLPTGEFRYCYYSVDNMSEDANHTILHHPTDNLILWKREDNVFSMYKLEAPIKW